MSLIVMFVVGGVLVTLHLLADRAVRDDGVLIWAESDDRSAPDAVQEPTSHGSDVGRRAA